MTQRALTQGGIAITDFLSKHDTHYVRKISHRVRGVWQEQDGVNYRRGCAHYALGYWRPVAYAKTGPILWVGERQPTIRGAVQRLLSWWAHKDDDDPLPPDSVDESLDEEEPPCPVIGTDEFFSRNE